jgi:hypothetical protein
MTYFFGLCLLLAIVLAIYVFYVPKLTDMNEGTWEIRAEIRMPEAPTPTPSRISQQLTKDDYVPKISIPGYECRMRRHRYPSHVLGNHVFWRIQCEGPRTIQGSGHVKYSGDTVNGKIQLRTVGDEGGQKRFNAKISGFRSGTYVPGK